MSWGMFPTCSSLVIFLMHFGRVWEGVGPPHTNLIKNENCFIKCCCMFLVLSGFVCYISPPRAASDMWLDPLHVPLYVAFVLAMCAMFVPAWTEMSGSSARDVARQLKKQVK